MVHTTTARSYPVSPTAAALHAQAAKHAREFFEVQYTYDHEVVRQSKFVIPYRSLSNRLPRGAWSPQERPEADPAAILTSASMRMSLMLMGALRTTCPGLFANMAQTLMDLFGASAPFALGKVLAFSYVTMVISCSRRHSYDVGHCGGGGSPIRLVLWITYHIRVVSVRRCLPPLHLFDTQRVLFLAGSSGGHGRWTRPRHTWKR